MKPERYKNHYFALRHGKSKANELGIVLSHPDDGIPNYGLVEEGRKQVRLAVEAARKNQILGNDTIIVTSDFRRTRETAEIASSALGALTVILEPRLRERFFGAWDKQQNSAYQKVWDDDVAQPGHTNHQVESTEEVLRRTAGLIQELEDRYRERTILLVSHGDALQILQTTFAGVPSHLHRSLPHLETAEIRRLS